MSTRAQRTGVHLNSVSESLYSGASPDPTQSVREGPGDPWRGTVRETARGSD